MGFEVSGLEPPPSSLVHLQAVMHRLDRHRALPDRARDALGRTAPHVADGEHARQARFKGRGREAAPQPSVPLGLLHREARFNKALGVGCHGEVAAFGADPLGARHRADKKKEGGALKRLKTLPCRYVRW